MYEAMASAGVCSSHDAGSRIFFPGGGDCEGHGSQCEGGYLEVSYEKDSREHTSLNANQYTTRQGESLCFAVAAF